MWERTKRCGPSMDRMLSSPSVPLMPGSLMRTALFGLTMLVVAPPGAWAGEVGDRARAEARLQETLAEILRSPELGDAEVGVHVRSLRDGHTVFERNSAKLFNPASNVKLVTSAAAFAYLGPNYRFKTVVYRDKPMSGGVLNGNLYIRGFGDPTLTDEQLFGLVNEIALSGISEVKGDLVVDDTFFDQVYEGPGWDQEYSDHSYAPSMSALAINYGNFTLRILPGDSIGSAAKVLVWPEIPSIELTSSAVTRGDGTRSRVFVGTSKGDGNKVVVNVRGAVSLADETGLTLYRRVYHPTMYAGEEIRSLLEMRGVKIKGKVRLGPANKTGVVVATHLSRPLAEVASVLNKFSNNFIAEQMLKTLGAELRGEPGTWEKGCSVAAQFLQDIGVTPGSFILGNGSGLNDINRLTPEQITRILDVMYSRFELAPEYIGSLAVAGSSGTINSRFANSPATARLRAKTGSLTGVSALSGYVVSKDNHLFAFSVMMNGYSGRTRSMWKVQDRIGTALAEFQGADVLARP
jgi:serine-type D-Ala-D-Ala carboxypeptidase/endopeptidase (penicillin-binding protein 4)